MPKSTLARPMTKVPVVSLRSADVREAALMLFAKRGYHATTMRDIAGALGLQAPSLYNHVTSKQELLRDAMVETMEALLTSVTAALASTDDVTEQLRRATEAHVRYHAVHQFEVRVGNYEIPALEQPHRGAVVGRRKQYSQLFLDIIERGVAEGRFDCRSPLLASYAILQMGIGVSLWFREDGPLSADSVAYTFGDTALRIVGARDRRPDEGSEVVPASKVKRAKSRTKKIAK